MPSPLQSPRLVARGALPAQVCVVVHERCHENSSLRAIASCSVLCVPRACFSQRHWGRSSA
eukprot:3834614-Amphidinium_carterae.1